MDDEQRQFLFKETEMIQSCITRMARDSFLIKGWAITLIVALFGILYGRTDWHVLIIAAFITLMFWYLDAFFLKTERMYRKKYDHVVSMRLSGDMTDLMDMKPICPGVFEDRKCNIWHVMFSKTLICFYCSIMIVSVLMTVL